MGKFSLHIKHYKATQLVGIDRHNRRLGRKHSNKSIDCSKSIDNIELKPVTESLYKDTKKRIQEEVLSRGHRVTKSSIWITEVCATLPNGIDSGQSEAYFSKILSYFENKFGQDNIMSAYIHMDETTPHLHMDILPLTVDGHLSRKKIWTRQCLIQLHDELPDYLRGNGFDVVRGDRLEDFDSKDKAKMSFRAYKIYQEQEKIKGEYNSLVDEYNNLVDEYETVVAERRALNQGNLRIAQRIIARCRQPSR